MRITMQKKIFLLCAVLLAFTAASCKDSSNSNEPPTPEIPTLMGTKWKLVGIVDVETNEIRVLEPKDCEECYTIEFRRVPFTVEVELDVFEQIELDGLIGRTVIHSWNYSYEVDYILSSIRFIYGIRFLALDSPEDAQFYDRIIQREFTRNGLTFEFNETELKLYYNDGKNYLLYEKRQ